VPLAGYPKGLPLITKQEDALKLKLSNKIIPTLELPTGKTDLIVWDSEISGFGLRVRNRTGVVTKTWVVQKKKARRCFKITIGGADVITLDAARKRAVTELAKIALGEDPQTEGAKHRHLLKALIPDYLKRQEKRVRPRSLVEIKRYLTGDHFKPLHNLSVDQIKLFDVSKQVEAIEDERGSATAREARTALSGFFSWAMEKGLAPANPVVGSTTATPTKARTNVLTDAELAAIWNACNGDDHGKIVRLLILLGARRSEVGGMAWSEFDDPERPTIWTLPAARSKNDNEHELPLPSSAVEIIRSAPRLATRDQLFGVRNAGGFSAWDAGAKALNVRLGDSVRPWTLHDIRRTVATRMGKLGVLPHVIECVLNHQSGFRSGVGGVYNRNPYAREVRTALVLWEDHVSTLIDGGKRKVVTFPQSA
jgi:integrase